MAGKLPAETLFGCVEQRGSAWIGRDDLKDGRSTQYDGFIPVPDLIQRLFPWSPVDAEMAFLVPADDDYIGEDRVYINGKNMRVVRTQQGRKGVLRSDNLRDLGVFKGRAVHLPYQATLIREAEKLTGTTLGVSCAGVIDQGARAWVEYSLPESLHDDLSGLDYRPNLWRGASMDGSLAHTSIRTVTALTCDNQLPGLLLSARASGMLFRRKNTSGAFSTESLRDERAALGIIEQVNDEFTLDLHRMIEVELSREKRIEVMDIMAPPPGKGASARGVTMANNKRDALVGLSRDSRVSPWVGTAFGELQRYNTFDHHLSNVRGGGGRSERNTWRTLSGLRAAADRRVIRAIETVMA